MTYFAQLASDGSVTGFFSDEPGHAPVPSAAQALTDSDWLQWIANPGGFRWSDGQLAPYAPSAAAQLSQMQTVRAAVLATQCRSAIVGGFPSSALGAAHTYPSKPADQANMTSVLLAGAGGALWCADASGSWSMVEHTAAQVSQVNVDWVAFRTTQQAKLTMLTALVRAAVTADAANSVTWS